MRRKLLELSILSVFFTVSLFGQKIENTPQKVSFKGKLGYRYVPSIKEQINKGTFISGRKNGNTHRGGRPKLQHGNKVVPGKGSKGVDVLAEKQRNAQKKQLRSVSTSFNSTTSTGTPSDPSGAVGGNYFIASWNTQFQIFNKDGTAASALMDPSFFGWQSEGDQIVLYDADADRYIVTQFADTPKNGFTVAISETNDPINDGWHTYSSNDFSTGSFPDYTKFSIWSDGYYVTANIGNEGGPNTWTGQVWALERDAMLIGDPADIQAFFIPGIQTNGFYSPQFLNVSDGNMPTPGNATLVYMQDDAWSGVANDHLKLWTIDVDWVTPANSTISVASELAVTDFIGVFDGGNFANLSQPSGPDIDVMQATIMNQAQFRKFVGYNSAVFNFVVDTDPSESELAGVRWYELRQTGDGQPWAIYQEGTYIAPNGKHAFGASMAMDSNGNIGMGYSTVSENESISLQYTGRFNGDLLGVMTGREQLIIQSGEDNNSTRYADYSHLTVDADDSFWFVSEYFRNGVVGRSNRVAQFTIELALTNDVGVNSIASPGTGSLGANEIIQVVIKNFGSNSVSNIPVSYSIDGSTAINEVYNGTILAGESYTYSFAQTADLSIDEKEYSILASTNFVGDSDSLNDSTEKSIVNSLYCMPSGDCDAGDILTVFQIGTIDHISTCLNGYSDSRTVETDLDRSAGNNVHIGNLQTDWGPEHVSMWIDFNDNGDFTDTSEQLIDTQIVTIANTDEAFTLTIPTNAPIGNHVLRVRTYDPDFGGNLNDPCGILSYGNTEDFTVNIVDSTLGIENVILGETDFKIITKPNKQFEIILGSSFEDKLTFNLFNLLGQQLVFNVITKQSDGKYRYDLDMSYAASGVYLVKVGRGNRFVTGRLIVE